MDVAVTVMTYKTRPTLWRLLYSLEKQSYKHFDVDIIFKDSEDRKRDKEILDRIMSHKKLSIKVIKQYPGYFEEAMNTIFNETSADILVNTDDDAYASRDWVWDHVALHKKHPKVGMATGNVIEQIDDIDGFEAGVNLFLQRQKWRLNKHTIIDPPVSNIFKGYGKYIGKSGMMVDTGRRHNMINTIGQHGVNMSWKREALDGFKIPGYTKTGGRNEAAAALESLNRGMSTIWFKKGVNYHPLVESQSRTLSISDFPRVVTAECVTLAYYTSKIFDTDMKTLALRTRIDDAIARIITGNKNDGYNIGYKLAKAAIKGDWTPAKLRRETKKIFD